jgi:hypothetical protein
MVERKAPSARSLQDWQRQGQKIPACPMLPVVMAPHSRQERRRAVRMERQAVLVIVDGLSGGL